MNKWITKLSIGIIIGSLFVFLTIANLFQGLENKFFDNHQTHHNHISNPLDILLIELAPRDRPLLPSFLKRALKAQAKLIGLDLNETYQMHGKAIISKLEHNEIVPIILSGTFEYNEKYHPSIYLLPPIPLNQNYDVGYSNYSTDSDRVVRQLPIRLAYATNTLTPQTHISESFAYQIYKKINMTSERNTNASLIHYNSPTEVLKINHLNEQNLIDKVKNKLVIIAEKTPREYLTPSRRKVSKVEMHGHALLSLFNQHSYSKPHQLYSLLPLFLAILSVLCLTPFLKWFWAASLSIAIGLLSIHILSYLLLLNYFQIWIPAITPSLAILGTWGGLYTHFQLTDGKDLKILKSSIKRHLPEQRVKQLLVEHDIKALHTLKQNEKRTATVLFADITGFAQMTEQLPSDQVIDILDEFLTAMTDIIFRYEGTLDKYMGDGIMAVFGNIGQNHPHQDAKNAVQSAIKMQIKMETLQRKWMLKGLRPIQIRIGLNTGDVLVGHVGHPSHKELTVIGDVVNTASRLEQLNKNYQTNILISQSTYEVTKDFIEVASLGEVELKGKLRPISVYEIKGWKRS